jgi:tetratricopeptide (TPR) repeat protein
MKSSTNPSIKSVKLVASRLGTAAVLLAFCGLASRPITAQQLVSTGHSVSSGHGDSQQQSAANANADVPVVTPELAADLLAARQNYQAAIDAYQNLPQTAMIYNKIGMSYQHLSKYSDARFYYDKAIKTDRQFAPAYNNYGTIEYHDRDTKHAERLYRKSIKIDGKTAAYWSNLGSAYMADTKYRDAVEAYQRAFAIDSDIFQEIAINGIHEFASQDDLVKIDLCFAQIYAQAGMKDQAVEYLRKALMEGFHDTQSIQKDQQFATLHGDPAFEKLLAQQKK